MRRQKTDSRYYAVSGSAVDDCCFLGVRYPEDEDFRVEEGESWLLAARAAADDEVEVWLVQGTTRALNGVWRSPSGKVFIVDDTGNVFSFHRVEPNVSPRREQHELPTSLTGIWGLDDSFVLAWGYGPREDSPVFRWDGTRWDSIGTPRMNVQSIHGCSPAEVWAVGREGRTARWDGHVWTSHPSPVQESLVSVWVTSPDERWAVGNGGSLLEGRQQGWIRAAQSEDGWPLQAVARFQGETWIAAGAAGLLRRVGHSQRLEVVRKSFWPYALDARGQLLMAARDCVVSTSDGVEFESAGEDTLTELREGRALREW